MSTLLTFFNSVPKDPKVRQEWYAFCGLGVAKNDSPSPESFPFVLRLCEKHFKESDIFRKKTETGRTKLSKTATPCLNPEKLIQNENQQTSYKSFTCQLCVLSPSVDKSLHTSKKISYFRYLFCKLITSFTVLFLFRVKILY
jgi:hypothetical protein